MHKLIRFTSTLLLLTFALFSAGCGGSGDSSTGPAVPTEFVTLNGVLRAPDKIESSLIPSLLQNTDSQVRTAFQSAQVFVNGAPNGLYSLAPLSSNPDWQFRIPNVGKSADGNYRVEVVVGKLNLKSLVKSSEMSDFRINLETTAALMLADTTGISVDNLLASYPSFVTNVENSLVEAFRLEAAKLSGMTTQAASVTATLQAQKQFFTELGEIDTTAKLAYLQKENDIDGDGIVDLKIESNLDGTRIRFLTTLSSYTSLLGEIAGINSYSDERLLQDFKENLVSDNRTFGSTAANFALGLYLKKSAEADVYLKLFVRRIDIEDGSFKGVVAEYEFVNSETTALVSGSKTFLLSGASASEGAVAASNFITDTEPGPYVISFLNLTDGLGSNETRLVRAIVGQPELAKIPAAEPYLEGGGNYHLNTTAALKAVYLERGIEVGDVFSAYFPSTKNYAVFKIKWIGSDKLTVDYIVNAAENEPRFQ
ncbi:MAG: hypothetical protein PWR01_2909 [Clostridiales bacterium]|jgi:hypothetical protein|nr:hypothetical protein [Clostridiales bacterium]MDN5281836.1 hypothetical protein [Candidatus Ozemobacter sp.]